MRVRRRLDVHRPPDDPGHPWTSLVRTGACILFKEAHITVALLLVTPRCASCGNGERRRRNRRPLDASKTGVHRPETFSRSAAPGRLSPPARVGTSSHASPLAEVIAPSALMAIRREDSRPLAASFQAAQSRRAISGWMSMPGRSASVSTRHLVPPVGTVPRLAGNIY
jgi:hypothetical protein